MTKIISSEDNAHTLLSEKYGVTYHSKYGAIQETKTVFIDAGLHAISGKSAPIKILEMGFGTGLNAIMTLLEATNTATDIDYHTIEAYPVDLATIKKLNFPTVLEMTPSEKQLFYQMHESKDGVTLQLNEHFKFTKYIEKLEDISLPAAYFDCIYFDAFAPTAQAELWTPEIMKKLYAACTEDSVLVTYCAKGSFKRALKSAGFTVEALPGPKGKREMTRASKR